jgi:hypothetical protein
MQHFIEGIGVGQKNMKLLKPISNEFQWILDLYSVIIREIKLLASDISFYMLGSTSF